MKQLHDATDSIDLDVLVDRAVNGDAVALERVLGRIHPVVVRYCRSRMSAGHRSSASADDVAQEVCMAVFTALPTFRHEGKPFLAFVYGICAHKVADAHRAAARSRTPLGRRGSRRPVHRARARAARGRQLDGAGHRRPARHAAGDPAGDPPASGGRRAQRRRNRRSARDDGRCGSGVATSRTGKAPASAVHRRRAVRAVGLMAGRSGRRRRAAHRTKPTPTARHPPTGPARRRPPRVPTRCRRMTCTDVIIGTRRVVVVARHASPVMAGWSGPTSARRNQGS